MIVNYIDDRILITVTPKDESTADAALAKIYRDEAEVFKDTCEGVQVVLQDLIDNLSEVLEVQTELPEILELHSKLTELLAIFNKLSTLDSVYASLTEIEAVSAKLVEITTLYTNIASIQNVNDNIASIVTVASDSTVINSVYDNLTKIDTLYTNILAIISVYTNIGVLQTLNSNITELQGIYTELTKLVSVYTNLASILAVEAKLTEISAVYAKLTQINAIYNSLTQLQTLYTNLSALLNVEADLTNINIVATDIAKVIIAANNIDNINTNAVNIQAIIDAPAFAQLAKDYANKAEDSEVETGKYSALHWAAKSEGFADDSETYKLASQAAKGLSETARDLSEKWAEETEDVEVTTGKYSSKHWANKSEDSAIYAAASDAKAAKWAEEEEDIAVETGKYSAKHWAKKAELYYQNWYGVEIDTAVSSPTLPRIGNLDLHRTLPVHNNRFACLLNDDGSINYKLNPLNWAEKLTGGASKLDGTDGQVMIYLPGFWWKWDVVGSKNYPKISEFELPGFAYSKPEYLSAYKASLQRSTLKLSSVKNNTTDYRGGGNQSAWDALAQSQLQMPVTSLSRTNFRTYARNRGAGWEAYNYHAWWKMFMLFTIEYATLNSQTAVNTALDASGFKQGGLGNGVTDVNSTKWSHLYSYYPLIPNGASDSLASGTGEVTYTLPFEFDVLPPTFVNAYSAATAYTVGQYTSYNNLLYKCKVNSTGNLPTNTDYWNPAPLYKGAFVNETLYQPDDYVSEGVLLYRCILESTGNAVTNTTYFVAVTRSTTKVNRYRGIEMPFGHIWDWCEGVNIRAAANSDADPTHKAYVSYNPADWNDANYTNYTLIGQLSRNDGYIKQMIPNHFLPLVAGGTGAGSSAYWCDYFYQNIPASGVALRGLLLGGAANYGAYVGLGSAATSYVPSSTSAHFGSRLCFLPSA